jgi:hypothetical protein
MEMKQACLIPQHGLVEWAGAGKKVTPGVWMQSLGLVNFPKVVNPAEDHPILDGDDQGVGGFGALGDDTM